MGYNSASSRNLFVWSAVFLPKWNDIQKMYKNYQNPVKSNWFLGYFQRLFNGVDNFFFIYLVMGQEFKKKDFHALKMRSY